MSLTVFCLVLLITLSCQGVGGIKCYTCVQCAQPFNPQGTGVTVVHCDGSCRTLTTEDPRSTAAIDRSCFPGSHKDGCSSFTGPGYKKETRCLCSRDLCNGDPNGTVRSRISLGAILTFVVARLIF